MRIIAGKYKGRTLTAPKGSDTRPTLDRTKETLFNILHFRLQDAAVLDLFAGSGQLALESLSRGARRAVVCDNDRNALSAIKSNFDRVSERPEIFACSYSECLAKVKGKFDIVFVDPPYKSGYYGEVLRKIAAFDLLTDDGAVICEHSAEDEIADVEGMEKYDVRKIGTVKFSFFKRSVQQGGRE